LGERQLGFRQNLKKLSLPLKVSAKKEKKQRAVFEMHFIGLMLSFYILMIHQLLGRGDYNLMLTLTEGYCHGFLQGGHQSQSCL
jgi:hypothetical protein